MICQLIRVFAQKLGEIRLGDTRPEGQLGSLSSMLKGR